MSSIFARPNVTRWGKDTKMGTQYQIRSVPGKSHKHASSVRLIRNQQTEYIYPQFHVIYDIKFHTVMGGDEDNAAVVDYI